MSAFGPRDTDMQRVALPKYQLPVENVRILRKLLMKGGKNEKENPHAVFLGVPQPR
jgi:hypothetical protein